MDYDDTLWAYREEGCWNVEFHVYENHYWAELCKKYGCQPIMIKRRYKCYSSFVKQAKNCILQNFGWSIKTEICLERHRLRGIWSLYMGTGTFLFYL